MEREIIDSIAMAYMEVIEDKKGFYSAISDHIYSGNFDKKIKAEMVTVVGACVRHHLFYKVIMEKFGEFELRESFYYIAATLTDIFFTKRLNREECIQYGILALEINEPTIDIEIFKEICNVESPLKLLESCGYEYGTPRAFSVRYNVPEWIFNLWAKQYGKNIAIKTVIKLTSKQKQYVKINSRFDLTNSFELPEDEFVPSESFDGLYEYIGQKSLKKSELIANYKIFTTNEMDNELLNSLKNLDLMQHVAFYFYEKSNFHINLMNSLNGNCRLSLFCNDFTKTTKSLDYIKKYKNNNTLYAQAACDSLNSYIEKGSLDLFVLFPDSSNLNYVNSSPEYLINFDSNKLDGIIRTEKDDIECASEFIAEGGYLVYATHTLNKKENEQIVSDFLVKHQNFSLVCEKTTFNTNKKGSVFGFYAILMRNN